MPVQIEVPLRVRIPREASAAELASLEVAVGDAARRALERCRSTVLEQRGARPLVLERPAFSFTGLSLGEGRTEAVHRAIEEGLRWAVAESGIETHRAQPAKPAALGATRVAERLDRSRWDRTGGTYRIPVFDDGDEDDVPTDSEGDDDATYAGAVPYERALALAWQAHLRRTGGDPDWRPAAHGYPGYYGAIETRRGTATVLLYFKSVMSLAESGYPSTWEAGVLYPIVAAVTSGAEGSGVRQSPTLLAPHGDHTYRRTESPVTDEDIAAILRRSDPTIELDVARAAARLILRSRSDLEVWWEFDGERIPGPRGYVSPIHFIVGTFERAEGEGGRGGGATGADRAGGGAGGPAGGAAAEGAAGAAPAGGTATPWPVLGTEGDELVCEALHWEVPASDLARGGDVLTERMRYFAREFGVPECSYMGQFALNCASVLGGIARAIALSATEETTTTQVTLRPGGDGNMGVVEVRPTETAGLQQLRLLASLVHQLADFARAISEVYEIPENRFENPIRWAIRFHAAFNTTLIRSCAHLYAETCRVVLLQQLYGSREYIGQRRANIDRTKRDFDVALGTMGESIAQLMVLKRALGLARVAGSQWSTPLAGPTGLALLAIPNALTGEATFSDYISSARDLVNASWNLDPGAYSALLDAEIVREGDQWLAVWRGRRWNDSDLDQAISVRRGLLNSVDPLFLQVDDLEALYRRYRANPEATREYLEDLLGEMADANAELIEESRDPDDGAFFALETTQYVRAQGGYNSRGLRFDLGGLHQMADDVLRPHTYDSYHYKAGVDYAIGRKAGFDDFLMVFSTAGIIVLGVVCAPLGAVAAGAAVAGASLGLAAYDLYRAHEREEVYRALEDPELILSWQEVQLEYMMAGLSAAFAVFDVVPFVRGARAAVGVARGAIREATEQGLRQGLRAVSRAEYERILRNMTGQVMEQAIRHAVLSVGLNEVMAPVFQAVIVPVIEPLQRASAIERGAGVTPAALRAAGEDSEVEEELARLEAAGLDPEILEDEGGAE